MDDIDYKPMPKWPFIIFGILILGIAGQSSDTVRNEKHKLSEQVKPVTELPNKSRVSEIQNFDLKEGYNSTGFSVEDRDLLDELDITEQEAQALETILRENGIE